MTGELAHRWQRRNSTRRTTWVAGQVRAYFHLVLHIVWSLERFSIVTSIMQAVYFQKAFRKIGMYLQLTTPSHEVFTPVQPGKPRETLLNEYENEQQACRDRLRNQLDSLGQNARLSDDDRVRANLGLIIMHLAEEVIYPKLGFNMDWPLDVFEQKLKELPQENGAIYFDVSAITLVKANEVKNMVIANASDQFLEILTQEDLGILPAGRKRRIAATMLIAMAMYFGEANRTGYFIASILGTEGLQKMYEVLDGSKTLSLFLFDELSRAIDYFTDEQIDEIFLSRARIEEIIEQIHLFTGEQDEHDDEIVKATVEAVKKAAEEKGYPAVDLEELLQSLDSDNSDESNTSTNGQMGDEVDTSLETASSVNLEEEQAVPIGGSADNPIEISDTSVNENNSDESMSVDTE